MKMPEPLIVGNWKMNTTVEEAEGLATTLRHRLEAIGGIQTAVCPPFVSLATVAGALRGSSVAVGAQNMHFEARGAYTGEVAPEMLANTCRYVVLGHSERRQHFGETDELINRKVKAAGRVGLTPILCVGERLPDREQGRAEDVVKTQLAGCLDGVDSAADLVVAYEPVWAIGTGKAATPDVAQALMTGIRQLMSSRYGADAAANVPLLYGGSVTPDNAFDFMREKDVDGALVGGASLDVDSFVEIARRGTEAKA